MRGLILALLVVAGGCKYLPPDLGPRKGYWVPVCGTTQPGVPCRTPNASQPVSACEKRFGKELCDRGRPAAGNPSPR